MKSSIAFWLCLAGSLTRVCAAEPGITFEVIGAVATSPDDASNPVAASREIRLEIHLRQRQLVVYDDATAINTYPIAVGRPGCETPIGDFRIYQMIKDPSWQHPLTGRVYLPGETGNQLGHYWIGFWKDGKSAIGFHDTPQPKTVGKPLSHGCIRMYREDIEYLFHQVKVGTVVSVIP